MSELKPCPFCGSVSLHIGETIVSCHGCNASGPNCYTQHAAIAAWNKRAEPSCLGCQGGSVTHTCEARRPTRVLRAEVGRLATLYESQAQSVPGRPYDANVFATVAYGLRNALKAEPEPSDGPRFKVGDEVIWGGRPYTIRRVLFEHYQLTYSDGHGSDVPVWEGALKPAPEPLPDDHIDRHWVMNALIVQEGWQRSVYRVVGETTGCVRIAGKSCPIGSLYQRDELLETGWSFHPDSPIQERRDV